VIGGGDWSVDRIIPDCVKSWSVNEKVKVRNPHATRPWQHVLEPLSGYLALGASLESNTDINGEAYNFGPAADQNYSVSQLINEMKKNWDNVNWEIVSGDNAAPPEAGLLKLNCDKALFDLQWSPALDFEQTVKFTVDWYRNFYEEQSMNMHEFCKQQIDEYTSAAKNKNIYWATND
jgi:CDP-glucose 4,6-dehydratase